VSASDLAYDRYITHGIGEWRLRIGPATAPLLLFLPPLFEEMNRTRALLVATMRALAERGWASILPDLPGTGESERPLEDCSWEDWRAAARDAAHAPIAGVVSMRGGCLLDDAVDASCAWRLSPAHGAALLRDLERAARISEGGSAGYAPSLALRDPLAAARPAETPKLRTVRLEGDRGEAALKLPLPRLWRRSEPQNSSEFVSIIASDIDLWVRSCGA